MVKFRNIESDKTTNLAGGDAYKESHKLELVSLLLTSFVADTFHDKASDQLATLNKLCSNIWR